jgi:hypothetical protein
VLGHPVVEQVVIIEQLVVPHPADVVEVESAVVLHPESIPVPSPPSPPLCDDEQPATEGPRRAAVARRLKKIRDNSVFIGLFLQVRPSDSERRRSRSTGFNTGLQHRHQHGSCRRGSRGLAAAFGDRRGTRAPRRAVGCTSSEAPDATETDPLRRLLGEPSIRRQREPERRALAELALDRDSSAVRRNDLLADEEPQAEPAAGVAVDLPKPFEHVR